MPPDTKDKIVYAAMMLFAQKGYGSTSVADILHAAGVNAGSLYYFFPGKQDVLLAVLDAYLRGIHPMLLAPAWKDVADPIERVFALLDAIARRSSPQVHVRMPDRKHRNSSSRAPPRRSATPRREFHRMAQRDRAVLHRRG